jgi:hypothetical protein
MSEPGVDPSPGKSSGDDMRLPERHPACRRREARPGFRAERENLNGDAKGKGTSGSNREAESTDAPARGGLPRSSKETGVMLVERRGQVTDVGSEPTGNRRSSNSQRKAAAFGGGTSRMTRECQVRICERLGVKFPGPTRQYFASCLPGCHGRSPSDSCRKYPKVATHPSCQQPTLELFPALRRRWRIHARSPGNCL